MATRAEIMRGGASGSGATGTAAVPVPVMRSVPASLVMLGVVIALVAAWGGIVAYVGPAFGFSGDGSMAWQWTYSHTLLALIPGAVGFVAGLLLISIAPRTIDGRGRSDLVLLGALTILSGAWFAVGPLAWPVIRTTKPYFVVASPFQQLTHQLGYAVGPGLILMACGGFAIGWAVRHQKPITPVYPAFVAVPAAVPSPVPVPAEPSGWSTPSQTEVAWAPAPAADPVPADPVPADPVPADPVPADPVPADPVPADPVPVDQEPVGEPPAPDVPTDQPSSGEAPSWRPIPPEPTERVQRSGRPVPPEPTTQATWPVVPPPGPATPRTQLPMGWRSPDVTGPVEIGGGARDE